MNHSYFVRTSATATLSLLIFSAALAQPMGEPAKAEPSKPYHFLLGAGFTAGGDTFISGTYTNGKSFDVTAGGGFELKGGIEYRLSSAFAVQGTVGYHSGGASGSNGNITFTRKPIEVLALWQPGEKIRLGTGIRKATGATLSGSGVASGLGNLRFDAGVGKVLQAEYFYSPKNALAFQYVNEYYTPNDGGVKRSGSHAGFHFFHYF